MMYYETPDYCVAHNPKVGCTSFAKAIVDAYYPDISKTILDTSPQFCGAKYIICCPKTSNPLKQVVCLIRNPIDRFVSALMQTKLDPNQAIDCLIKNKYYHFPENSKPKKLREDGHFREQSKLVTKDTILFRFPEDIEKMAQFIGIKFKMPHLNKSNNKIELTKYQKDFVHFYYYNDFVLYQSVTPRKYKSPIF